MFVVWLGFWCLVWVGFWMRFVTCCLWAVMVRLRCVVDLLFVCLRPVGWVGWLVVVCGFLVCQFLCIGLRMFRI